MVAVAVSRTSPYSHITPPVIIIEICDAGVDMMGGRGPKVVQTCDRMREKLAAQGRKRKAEGKRERGWNCEL